MTRWVKKYKHISKNKWYQQGTPAVPFYAVDPYSTAYDKFGSNNSLTYFVEDINKGFFSLNYYEKVTKKIINIQKHDKSFINQLYNKWKINVIRIKDLFDELQKKEISKFNKKQIIFYLSKIQKITYQYWYNSLLHEIFDPNGEQILKEQIRAYKYNDLPDEAIKDMIMPSQPFFQNIAERDLIEIALNKNIKNNFMLDNHIKKYHFINNTWSHVFILEHKDLINELRKYEKTPKVELIKRLNHIIDYPKNTIKKRKEIINNYNFPKELINIFYFFQILAEWRDERKIYSQETNYWQYLLVKRLSKLLDINIKLLLYSYPTEIIGHLKKGFPSNFKNILNERTIKSVMTRKNKITKLIVGKESEYMILLIDSCFETSHKEIKGQIANKGFIKSKVRIILHHKDFNKLRKGEIIVAAMTRPDYVPIMKIAGGIITDEGGITCHASIVSRELNLPCIVGTQVATKVLKDGMVVELDANKGIANIVK